MHSSDHLNYLTNKLILMKLLFLCFSNKSNTLSFESYYNYTAVDISPNGSTLLAVNESKYFFKYVQFYLWMYFKMCETHA